MSSLPIRRVNVLGVGVSVITLDQLLSFISTTIESGQRAFIAYTNIHAINLAYDDASFRRIFNEKADIVFCDGVGVKLASRFLGDELPERFTPPDWLSSVAQLASERDYTIYFLGNRPGVAELAVKHLQDSFPHLRIVGTHHGFFDKQLGGVENESVIAHINSVKPDILYVGFGMPLQEQWLLQNWDRLEARVAIPVGAMLDYIAEVTTRGPRWMTDNGFEWLTRLIIEPRRLWRRYLLGNPLFFWRILRQKFSAQRLNDSNG